MRKQLKPRNKIPKSVEPALLARPRARTFSKTRPLCSGFSCCKRRRLKSMAAAAKSVREGSLPGAGARRIDVSRPKRLPHRRWPVARFTYAFGVVRYCSQ